jgi:hypothetical protein
LRHTPEKKNKTDERQTPRLVPLRYVLGFVPVVTPVRRFFEGAITDSAELDALEMALGQSCATACDLVGQALLSRRTVVTKINFGPRALVPSC